MNCAGRQFRQIAGPGEVLVRTEAIDTIFLGTRIRGGWGTAWGVELPYVPGGAAAGRVDAVGPGVDPSLIGLAVLAGAGTTGTYAELVRTDIDRLVHVPVGLDMPEAAALAHDGVTAKALTEALKIAPSETVLILAAGGGLGTLLVQLAHAAGATVIGAARGRQKLDMIRELGADAVVDYSEPDWIARLRERSDTGSIDVLLDCVGGELGTAALGLVARGGRVSMHGAASGGFARPEEEDTRARGLTLRGIAHVQLEPAEMTRLATKVLAEAADGRLHPVIGRRFELAEAAKAHAAIESRSVLGKAILIP